MPLLRLQWLVGLALAACLEGSIHGPAVIYGTAWKREQTKDLVLQAVRQGFRAFDTANHPKHYNETLVGAALQEVLAPSPAAAGSESQLRREDLWIQTKFTPDACHGQPPELHPYDSTADVGSRVRQSLASSLRHLGVAYVDSLLLHAPFGARESTLAAWRELELIKQEGLARKVGVSNFNYQELAWLLGEAREPPSFVQNRCLHKDGWDRAVRELCRERGIDYQGFWLLTGNRLFRASDTVGNMAKAYGRTREQVAFAFLTQGLGIAALSGTGSAAHMAEDLEVASRSFTLTSAELKALEALEPPSFTESDAVRAVFRSRLEMGAQLFWEKPDSGELVDNGPIAVGGSVSVSTFHSHSFLVKSGGTVVLRWKANRSAGADQEVLVDGRLDVVFENEGSSQLQVYWHSSSGEEVLQGLLEAGGSLELGSHVGHRFVLRDAAASGRAVRHWTAGFEVAGRQRVRVGGAEQHGHEL